MMMGATVDEAMSYVAGAFANPMNDTLYRVAMRIVFKDDYDAVIAKYPPEVNLCFSLIIVLFHWHYLERFYLYQPVGRAGMRSYLVCDV